MDTEKEEKIVAIVMSIWVLIMITVICFGIFVVFPREIWALEANSQMKKFLNLALSFLWGGNVVFFVACIFHILKKAWSKNCSQNQKAH